MCPVTRPFELRGLLKIKVKKSELDLNFYRQSAVAQQSIEEEPVNAEDEGDQKEE